MSTFDRVKKLADKERISIVELEEKVGFSKNSLYSWKKNKPSAEKLEAVADYFSVTTDYLLGRTDNPSITEDEPSMAKQVMMRMNTNGLSDTELDEIESEMERFFAWRIDEIKREREE